MNHKRKNLLSALIEPLTPDLMARYLARPNKPCVMTRNQLPLDVQKAFDHWMLCNLWRSTLTRSEIGRLGAAKRKLNDTLRKHALTFDQVAQAMI